jgi:hypothetical protein
MVTKEQMRIENARLYPAAIVDRLQVALKNGAELHADTTRRNFYDLEVGGRAYFIYVAPENGNVTLIATWVKTRATTDEESNKLVSWWRRIASHSLTV